MFFRTAAAACLSSVSRKAAPFCAPDSGGVLALTAGGSEVRIACLPFVPEHKLLNSDLLMGEAQEKFTNYAERMSAMLDLLCAGFRADTVNLLVGHVYLMGAEASGSERAAHLAKPYALAAQRIPATASYVALGHLHRPQAVPRPAGLADLMRAALTPPSDDATRRRFAQAWQDWVQTILLDHADDPALIAVIA